MATPVSRTPIPRTICLCGPDGAGKSTQAGALVAWLRSRGHAARVCSPWDLLGSGTIPFRSKEEVDTFLSSVHSTARALFLHLAMRESLDRAIDTCAAGEIIVAVGYFPKYNATERALGTDPALLSALATSFPALDLLLYLDLPPETAYARKPNPSRYECGGGARERFIPFQKRVQHELKTLMNEHGGDRWQIIDATADISSVSRALAARVAHWLDTGDGYER